jgi:hypothetical protein
MQDVIHARTYLLKGLASVDANPAALQRIASFCEDETYPAGTIDSCVFATKVF